MIERLAECGLNTDGISVVHVEEHYYSEITFSEAAGVEDQHFECIREALRGENATFENTEIGQSYWQHVNDYYRPIYDAQTRDRVIALGLMNGFPQQSDYRSMEQYLSALESHAGLEGERYLIRIRESVTIDPARFQPPNEVDFDAFSRLMTVVRYAATISDLKFVIIGNAQFREED